MSYSRLNIGPRLYLREKSIGKAVKLTTANARIDLNYLSLDLGRPRKYVV